MSAELGNGSNAMGSVTRLKSQSKLRNPYNPALLFNDAKTHNACLTLAGSDEEGLG